VQKKNYPREPFYVIKIAPSPTKIIISRIVNINKNIRIVCLQSLQTIHNYQNYAYKVVYPSVYYRKKITHINYIWGLNFLVFEEINNKTQNWSNSSRAGGWTYKKKKRKKSYWTTFIISIKKKNNNYLLYFLLITKSFIELPPSSIYWLLKKLSTTNFQKKMFKKWNKTPKFQTFFWKIKRELTTLSWELHTCFKESKDQNLNYLKKKDKIPTTTNCDDFKGHF